MQQVTYNIRNGKINLADIPALHVKPGCVLVKNSFSVVSVGTEMMKVRTGEKSLIGKAKERPDQVRQVLDHYRKNGIVDTYKRVMNRLEKMEPLGYSSAGTVISVGDGVKGLNAGDRVACGGCGHAEFITVPKHLCALVPDNVRMASAAFSTLGAIAIHGIRQSEAKIGENIVIIGLGLIGQLVLKILQAAGCNVAGIDLDDKKLEAAKEAGIDLAIHRNDKGLYSRIADFSLGLGADAVIITAGTTSNDPVELTPKIIRDRGKVVVLGISKMDVPWRSYYEKEIELKFSRSYGPGRYDPIYEEKGVDYPVGYVRWTQQRNMGAFLHLLSKRLLSVEKLITHKFSFSQAEQAYEELGAGKLNGSLGVLFEYGSPETKPESNALPLKTATPERAKDQEIRIGMIGAGNYARNTILPIIDKVQGVELHSIVTEAGISAVEVQKKYGFQHAYTEAAKVMEDPEINTVIIATRHDTHASLVAQALQNKKHVFVEKPLALSITELQEIEKYYPAAGTILMVGYNRRFSPHIEAIRNFFKDRKSPLALNYNINAGMIPGDHWYQDPEKGGGRIVGECCHFIDVAQFITQEKPVRVYAESFSSENANLNNHDTANLLVKFSNGSIATINYFSCGDTSYPKEKLEVMGENANAILNDYRSLELIRGGKKNLIKTRAQDKGHKEEFKSFFDAIKGKIDPPISYTDMKNASLITIGALDSLKTGVPISL